MQKTSIGLFAKAFYAILFSKPASRVPKEIRVSSGAASKLKHPIYKLCVDIIIHHAMIPGDVLHLNPSNGYK